MNEALRAALECVCDAAVVSDEWPTALDKLSAALGAFGGVIVPRDPESMVFGFPFSHSVTEVMQAYIAGNWQFDDVRARAWDLYRQGSHVLIEHDISTEEERRSSPYYQELFGSFGMPWWGGVGLTVDGKPWFLTLIRAKEQGAYEHTDRSLLSQVQPHLTRAIQLAGRTREIVEQKSLELSGSLGSALVAIDNQARVIYVSPLAQLSIGDGIYIRHQKLETDRRCNNALQALISGAIKARSPVEQGALGRVVVRRDGRKPVIVEALSLTSRMRDTFGKLAALVLLRDLEIRRAPDVDLVREALNLTHAEARLCVELWRQTDLRKSAVALGISYETARTQLRAVFNKADVDNQPNLIAIIGKLADVR